MHRPVRTIGLFRGWRWPAIRTNGKRALSLHVGGRAAEATRAVTDTFFATTAKGLEALLADELRTLGATDVEPRRAGVAVHGPLEVGYRACLWSRVASRVLLPLASFTAETPAALYEGVRTIRWSEHLGPHNTIAVDCAV